MSKTLNNSTQATISTNTRQQGRRPRNDAVDIRQQIMDTAVDLFARQGYSATSIREIAASVGVNSAMVHYYFGSKEALLHEALGQSLEPLVEAVSAMKQRKEAPLQEIVALLLGVFARKPQLPILMTREVFLPGGVMQKYFMEHFAPRLGGALPQLLSSEQGEDHLRKDVDPRLVAQILLGLCAFPFISRSMAEPVLGVSYDENGMREIERHIMELLERGFLS
jgi:TetR/AcrR family transcriptional regulator